MVRSVQSSKIQVAEFEWYRQEIYFTFMLLCIFPYGSFVSLVERG